MHIFSFLCRGKIDIFSMPYPEVLYELHWRVIKYIPRKYHNFEHKLYKRILDENPQVSKQILFMMITICVWWLENLCYRITSSILKTNIVKSFLYWKIRVNVIINLNYKFKSSVNRFIIFITNRWSTIL